MKLRLSPEALMFADLKRSGLNGRDAEQLGIHIPDPKDYGSVKDPRYSRYRMPYFGLDGTVIDFWRDRFTCNPLPPDKKGKPRKYDQPTGGKPRLYFPPYIDWTKVASDPNVPLILTEGEKKSAAACKAGFPTIGIGGWWNWRSKDDGPIPDLGAIRWKKRQVVIAFDSDVANREDGQLAESELQADLVGRKALVKRIRLEPAPNGEKQGLDDLIVAHGARALRDMLAESKGGRTKPVGFELNELRAMKFPHREWVIPGFVPTGLSVLAGRPKVGKSWMALQLMLDKVLGAAALGKFSCAPGQVLLLSLEDTPKRAQSRIKKLIGNAKLPDGSYIFTEWPRVDDGGLDDLREWLDAHPLVKLVLIDTLVRLCRRLRSRRENPYHADYDEMAEFKKLADERGIAIVILHHLRKSLGLEGDVIDEVMGTTGTTAAPDTVIVLKRPRAQEAGTMLITGRDVHERDLAVQFSSETQRWNVLGDAAEFALSPERREILEMLKKIGHPTAPAEIAERLGKRRDSIKHTMHRMKWDGSLREVGGGKYEPCSDSTSLLHTQIESPLSPVTAVTAVTAVPSRGQLSVTGSHRPVTGGFHRGNPPGDSGDSTPINRIKPKLNIGKPKLKIVGSRKEAA